MNNQSRDEKPLLYLIKQQAPPPPLAIVTQEPRSLSSLDEYLTFLKERDFINEAELLALKTAIAPLRQHFSTLSTIALVRSELSVEGVTVDSLRRDERAQWKNENFLPWFNLDAALATFMVPVEEAERYVIFFNEECKKNARPFIRPGLEDGETFFWLILRMYRLQAQTQVNISAQEPKTWAQRWLPFLFR